MIENKFLLRSLMFVPGHNKKLLKSAANAGADALLLDLEDSVHPSHNKLIARETIVDFVESGIFSNSHVFPRINDRESGFLLKDVTALAIDGIDGFVYPKAHTGKDIYFFDKLLETIEFEKGLPHGRFKIIPLIETAAAVLNAQDICQASDRVVGIAFGCEDFITDINGIHDEDEQSLFTARAMIAMAARANNVTPIDTVHIDIHDLEDLERNLVIARKLGFGGMLVLHPKELPLAHHYFSPTPEEVADSKEMLRLYQEAGKQDKGVALMNGKFIGPPMVANAKKLLAKHALIKEK